jgi:outer membrane protein W
MVGMKKSTFYYITGLCMAFAINATAQNWYVRGAAGYSGEFSKTEFNNTDPNGITGIEQSTDVTISPDGSTATVKALNGTVGAGYKFIVTGGYMFNPYIGAELGINYFRGDRTLVGRLESPQLRSQATTYIQGFDLNPAIYITPAFSGFNPYVRGGLLLPLAGNLTIETDVRQINGGGEGTDIVVKAESEVKSTFSVGYSGALGVTYPINEHFGFFGEIEFKSLSIKSKSAEIKEYSTTAVSDAGSQPVPGQQLADLPRSEKEFRFTDNFTQSTNSPPPEDEPRKIPTQYVNASGIGFNLGVRYAF